MFRFLIALLAVTPFAGNAQGPATSSVAFRVAGSLPATLAHKAYLRYTVGKRVVLDSTMVRNGRFQFTGTVPDFVEAYILMPLPGTTLATSAERLPVYLERGTVHVTGTKSLAQAVAKGTPLNEESNRLAAQLQPAEEKLAAVYAAYEALPATAQTPAATAQFAQQTRLLNAERAQVYATYIQVHPSQPYSLYALESYVGPRPEGKTYAALFNQLAPSVRASVYGQVMQQRIQQLLRLVVGATAPDFSQADPSGKLVKLSDLRGHYVLLDFWASWCLPCRAENPNLVKLYQTYQAQGFTILGVSLDKATQRAAWLQAIEQDQLIWPQVSSLSKPNPVAETYSVSAIPQNFLLDPQGRILASNLFGDELATKLAEVFAHVK
jgi:peroxiredoxin